MYDFLLITHFIGLALGVGTSFANLRLGIATRDMEPAARAQFFLRAFALSKNASIGLLLLIVSGIGMLLVRGVHPTFVAGGTAFHAKLGLVVLLMGLFGRIQVLIKRARLAQGGPAMAEIPKIGQLMLLVGVGIVILAVLSFH
jgi:uncharacterized membrane protein